MRLPPFLLIKKRKKNFFFFSLTLIITITGAVTAKWEVVSVRA
jgi:hypothetical protein